MATICLVLGESGTGKSASMRNFTVEEMALVNVAKKPLPFRGKFEEIKSSDFDEIKSFMEKTSKKVIVIDDAQYIMAFQYMRRIKENGWDKYNDIQSDFFNVIEVAKQLPEEKIVFFLSHIETKEDGRQKIKTIGKMLDEKITVEGMFTVVLKTLVSDGKYYFATQNSGMDTVKSPIGMFPSSVIDNDLKYVTEKIRNYYYMDGAISDEAMNKADEAVKTDINPDEKPRKRKRRTEIMTVPVDDGKGVIVDRVPVVEEKKKEIPPEGDWTVNGEFVKAPEKPVRRRKRRTETDEVAPEEIPF